MPDRQGDTLDAMREETRAEGIDRDRRAPDAAGADDADRNAAGADDADRDAAVHELEGLGLVSRTPDPDDRRAQLLALTEHGSAQLSAAQTGRRRAMDASLSTWPVQDIRHLSRLLHALSGGLERHPAS